MRSSSPTTIRARRIRRRSSARSPRGIKAHRARVIPDRAAAIAAALNRAGAADIVLIAGKGHEDYQIYGATRRSFSDRDEAQRVLGVGGMKRTLAGGRTGSRRHRSTARTGPSARCRPTAARCRAARCSLRLRGPNFDGADFAAAALARGAVGAIVERALADVRAAAHIVVPDSLKALQLLASALARGVLHSDRRGGRQQRQDHGQGNDRGDPVAPRALHGDARQSQQPHRRAADADAPRAFASQRGDRDGREPHRRRGRARRARDARPSGSSPTPARSISKDSAISTASRAARAKWWRGFRPAPRR